MNAPRIVIGGLLLALLASCAGDYAAKAEDAQRRAQLHADLAANYLERGQEEVALQEVKQALAADSRNSLAHYVMALISNNRKEFAAADSHYRRALNADPKFTEARHNYSVFLCARGEHKAAFARFKEVMDDTRYPARATVRFHAGECALSQTVNDKALAEDYYRAALELDSKYPAALRRMAQLSFDKKEYLSARAYVQRYFEVGRDSPASLLLGVKVEKALRDGKAMEKYAQRLRDIFPGSDEARELQSITGR